MCRCLTTSSSSVSPSRAPTRWSRRRGACCTSTDYGHPGLHGSALPHDGRGARGAVAQAGRGRREGRRDARRGGDGQGGHGPGGARRRRAAAGRGGRGADGAGGKRRRGDRGAGRVGGGANGASVRPRARGEGGRRPSEARPGTVASPSGGRGCRGRNAREGVAPGETHRHGNGRRPEARHGIGTGRPGRETGPRRGWEKGEGRSSRRCCAARGAAAGTSGGAAAPRTSPFSLLPASSRSRFTTRPPGPDPVTSFRSTPESFAMRFANGDAFTRVASAATTAAARAGDRAGAGLAWPPSPFTAGTGADAGAVCPPPDSPGTA